MSSKERQRKKEQKLEYNKNHYHSNELMPIRAAIRYYQKKKQENKDYTPKPWSRLTLYCKEHTLDPIAVIDDPTLLAPANSE
jgi:hypothetical protein